MSIVTGMIGDRVYTLDIEGGDVQGDAAMVAAFAACLTQEDCLAHARKLFGDTMRVTEGAPAPVQFPFMADSPVKPGDVTHPQGMDGTPRIVNETEIAAPSAPGSAPMAGSPMAVGHSEDESRMSRRSGRG